WHRRDSDRLRFCVTPRFALSCTAELLRAAAELARARGPWVQTHVAEHYAELAASAAALPGARDYVADYDDHGVGGERSLVAHCPDPNLFLGSGRCTCGRRASAGSGSASAPTSAPAGPSRSGGSPPGPTTPPSSAARRSTPRRRCGGRPGAAPWRSASATPA